MNKNNTTKNKSIQTINTQSLKCVSKDFSFVPSKSGQWDVYKGLAQHGEIIGSFVNLRRAVSFAIKAK